MAGSQLQLGLDIERPRSALHAGDFTQPDQQTRHFDREFRSDLDCNIVPESADFPHDGLSTPWYKPLPSPFPDKTFTQTSPSIDIPDLSNKRPSRSRAPSLQSHSSGFVLKPPTSPLVHQSNNEDLDFSPIDLSSSPSKANRRHTLPPQTFQFLRTAPPSLAQAARQPPALQREHSQPYQGHQNRKSLTSISQLGLSLSPRTPVFLRSRRSSFASDASPIQHASMVGSYEESILRGRMSTTPSKPLDFTAQIGALGKGDCKPKYPAHVSVEFPAVYYSWTTAHAGPSLDEPSPYVGLIDLEHKLAAPPPRERRRRNREKLRLEEAEGLSEASNSSQKELRKREKRRRRSPSPRRLMTGGCYRIPQKGHLQILIKNPHKTAVKLFLVPYDLDGMEAGTKTFVRQRCYSAGPIIEKPITSRSISESFIDTKFVPGNLGNKSTLRYLIQLNICCPSKGKFYLYKNIHVVFANRVPDDKEKLRNEILWPEPRYSPWKPMSSSENVTASNTPSENMRRSKSYGFPKQATGHMDIMDGLPGLTVQHDPNQMPPPLSPASFLRVDQSITPARENLKPYSSSIAQPFPILFKATDEHSCADSLEASPALTDRTTAYAKLTKGEAGYGGVFGRPGTPEPGEGLLARRLKGLDVEKHQTY